MPKTPTKIEKFGVGSRVTTLRARGLSYQSISQQLKKELDIDVDWQGIRNFLQKVKNVSAIVTHKRQSLITKEAEERFEIINDTKKLKDEMWNFFEDLKLRQQDAQVIKCANHILENLKTLGKMLGLLKEHEYKVTYNIIDLAPKINQILIEQRKRGSLVCRKCGSTDIKIRDINVGV